MATARDDNRIVAQQGESSTTGTAIPVNIDPATGRLLLDIANVAAGTIVAPTKNRDDNRVPVAYGESTVDGTATPFRINPVTGRVLTDILIT